jgi:hypothetical protein
MKVILELLQPEVRREAMFHLAIYKDLLQTLDVLKPNYLARISESIKSELQG